jgi:high-affinity nickel-transport protein
VRNRKSHLTYGDILCKGKVIPALFTAGMSLVDTTDGVLMLGAYNWAFVEPVRQLCYNLVITAVSAVVAVLIGRHLPVV